MRNTEPAAWRARTDDGGLTWLDPGPDRPALRAALEDCAETLSPAGEPPALSTYWVDRLLERAAELEPGDIAHGNLWVLTAADRMVEVRMDVDPPSSEPIEVIETDDLIRGLQVLRSEVVVRLAHGHRLDDRYWTQKNPA